jgi:hypothetical protein
VLAHWQWFFTMGLMTDGDWFSLLPETMRSLSLAPSIWRYSGLGGLDLTLSMYPTTQFLMVLLSRFGDFALLERLVWFWPSVLIAAIGMYLLAYEILRSSVGGGVASLTFIFSTYMILGRTGHLTLMAAFAFVPLLLWLFIRGLRHSLIFAISAGLIGAVIGWYEARVLYIALWLMFFYFLYDLVLERGQGWRRIASTTGFACLTVIIILLANAFWIVPLSLLGTATGNELFSRSLFGNDFMNMRQALANFHPFWNGGKPAIFHVQPIGWQFFLLPALAFSGFMFSKEKRLISYFAFISLIGIFLSKQVAAPFGEVYSWLYFNFPGFGAFREASKFYFLIALGYGVLIGAFAAWLWEKRHLSTNWRGVAMLGIVGICALMLWNARPLVTGEIGSLFVAKEQPEGYAKLNRLLDNDSSFYRTLWIPNISRWGLWTSAQPRLSADEMDGIIQRQKTLPIENIMTSASSQAFFISPVADKILDLTGIKYVVVPCYDSKNEPAFALDYKSRAHYIKILSFSPFLQRVDLGISCPDVFVNSNSTDRLSLVQSEGVEEKKSNLAPYRSAQLTYERVGAYLYKVEITNLKEAMHLRFSDNYNSEWKIAPGEFSWFDVLRGRQTVLPAELHMRNEMGFNDFKLDPIELARKGLGRTNVNGGIDIEFALFFAPQANVWLGSIISVIIVLSGFLYLFVSSVYFVSRRFMKRHPRRFHCG